MSTTFVILALSLGLVLGFVLGRRYGRREMFDAYQSRFDAVTGKAAILEALLLGATEAEKGAPE